jgi:hypothetical protein
MSAVEPPRLMLFGVDVARETVVALISTEVVAERLAEFVLTSIEVSGPPSTSSASVPEPRVNFVLPISSIVVSWTGSARGSDARARDPQMRCL